MMTHFPYPTHRKFTDYVATEKVKRVTFLIRRFPRLSLGLSEHCQGNSVTPMKKSLRILRFG